MDEIKERTADEGNDDESCTCSDSHNLDGNGITFYIDHGFPLEQKPRTQWVFSASANACRIDADPQGYCSAVLVRPELMLELMLELMPEL